MTIHNARNERVKREYLTYLKEAKRLSEGSLDGVAAALSRFETYTRYKEFKQFHIQQAIGFKKHLAEAKNGRTGKPLSKATLNSTLNALKAFFQWLAGRPGYKSKLSYADAEYFNLSEKEAREARAHTERPIPTIEQILHAIRQLPSTSEIERRDRAILAFTLLTGARDGATASLKLKHIDLTKGFVVQDAREVKTKLSKTFSTFFFPVGNEVEQIVKEWVEFLQSDKLWGNDDPLFPATAVSQGNTQQFRATGLARKHWRTASPIREIFRKAFENAELPYFNPHSFRKTLSRLGEQICQTPEEFKAWSQNLGHEHVMTTFTSYGQVAGHRQGEIIRNLGSEPLMGKPDRGFTELLEETLKAAKQLR